MKLAVLFSGGKDSTYACYLAQKHHDVVCLLSIDSVNQDSYMFHTPNISFTDVQAEAMSIPLLRKATEGQPEKELKDLHQLIKEAKSKYNIEGVVTGAVGSVYQATRIQKICAEENLSCFNPLWQKNQEDLLRELLDKKFEVVIAGVAAYPLDESLLGKTIDQEILKKLLEYQEKYEVNPAGEGGEFETLVLNGPNFKKKIVIKDATVSYANHAGRWIVNQWEMES